MTVSDPTATKRPELAISREERAAVILAILDQAAARPIVEQLDERTLAGVIKSLERLKFMGRDQLRLIAMDFIEHLQQAEGALHGGPDNAREIVERLVSKDRATNLFGTGPATKVSTDPQGDVWQRLAQKPVDKIAAYLDRLTPNLAAMIIARLDTSLASDVLSLVDEGLLEETVAEMVRDHRPEPQIEQVLAQMIEIEFLKQSAAEAVDDSSQMNAIGELLSLLPDSKRHRVISLIESKDEDAIHRITKSMMTIDSLPDRLDPLSVPIAMREVNQALVPRLLKSLEGELDAVKEFLLGNISSRLAEQLRFDLSRMQMLNETERADVQRSFLSELMALKRKDVIKFT